MARTAACLQGGPRLTDHIGLGVLNEKIPILAVRAALASTGKVSRRQRDLPAHVVVYYVIAMALYMEVSTREVLRCLLEAVRWLAGPLAMVRVAGRSGISQARTRLGWEPLMALHDDVVRPVARPETRGAWYQGLRVVSVDGSTLDVADESRNAETFDKPPAGRGASAFPQVRFLSLVENGTHVLFGSRMGGVRTGEGTLAREVLPFLDSTMLCLADRGFYGFGLWRLAAGTGAHLLWRVKANMRLECLRALPDGSFASAIYPTQKDRRKRTNGTEVRVIEYRLLGSGAGETYRLITDLMDHGQAPARELAALYAQRWEIEGAFDELKTHLRGRGIVLRSKTPDLVKQEFYGLLLAHYAIRNLMHEAALDGDEDPDHLSFVHSVRVLRRRLPQFAATPPSGEENLARSCALRDT